MSDIGENPNVLRDVQGTVKWFDHKKGFGFLVGPEEQDIFVHYTQIEGEGFKVLKDGGTVRYDAEKGPKGWYATRVVRVEPEVKTRAVQAFSRSPRR